MNKGFLIYVKDSKEKNYIESAYALALSLKLFVPDSKISLVTDSELLDSSVFDKIIEIPWNSNKENSRFKTEDRWKLYHCSPYEKTIVLDADMLVLSDISHYWNYLSKFDIFIPNFAKTYRNEVITDKTYRAAFYRNNLPDLYSGFLYFQKSNFAKEFYTYIELVNNNWEFFYGKFVQKDYPNCPSMDISTSIVCKILGVEQEISDSKSFVHFVHMKPYAQNWKNSAPSWQQSLSFSFNKKCLLNIGGYIQSGIFHYTEQGFLKNYMIKYLKNNLGV